jgi:hypothetical protein
MQWEKSEESMLSLNKHAHYLAGTLSEKSRGLACGIVERERKTEREIERDNLFFQAEGEALGSSIR